MKTACVSAGRRLSSLPDRARTWDLRIDGPSEKSPGSRAPLGSRGFRRGTEFAGFALARVLRLLEDAAAEVPEAQKAPPRALFTGFGDSSLDFRLFAWVESVDIGVQAQNGLRMAIPRTLDAAGTAIPFPQRDLHIRYAPPGIDMAATLKT